MTSAPQTLRITSQADLVTAVPYLLGFHPKQCVVLIGSREHQVDRRSFVARIDLPDRDSTESVAAVLVETAARARLDAAVLVVYAGIDLLPDGGRSFVENLVGRLTEVGAEVKEAIRVEEDRWWGYLCAEHGCCAGAGHVVMAPGQPGGSSLIAAQAVAEGWAPLESRAALADTLRPVSEIGFAAVEQALADLMTTLARPADDPEGAWRRVRLGTVRLVDQLLTTGEAGDRIDLSPQHAALLLTGLQDTVARDLCLGWTRGERGRAAVEMWSQLVRMAPPPLGAVPATVLAYVAWQRGGGAIVTLALERALAHDPNDRLARLLADLVFGGVDPTECTPAVWLAQPEPDDFVELDDVTHLHAPTDPVERPEVGDRHDPAIDRHSPAGAGPQPADLTSGPADTVLPAGNAATAADTAADEDGLAPTPSAAGAQWV